MLFFYRLFFREGEKEIRRIRR